MKNNTITFLRALCAKVKEVATLCDAYLEQEGKKGSTTIPKPSAPLIQTATESRFIPLKDWKEYHKWPTANAFKNLIFNSGKNGSDYFIRRAGRRLLICEKSFFEWLNMSQDQRIKASPEAARYHERFGKKR